MEFARAAVEDAEVDIGETQEPMPVFEFEDADGLTGQSLGGKDQFALPLNLAGLSDAAQGSVGGGTGMICYDYKGGSGSASRVVPGGGVDSSLGVFVQANFGIGRELVIGGVPAGRDMPDGGVRSTPAGTMIAVLATEVPQRRSTRVMICFLWCNGAGLAA